MTKNELLSKITPKPYQTEAIEAAKIHFNDHDRGQLVMACGTGKTLTSLWIAKSLEVKSILIALPSLQLQAQTILTWKDSFKSLNFKMLAIGSDKTFSNKFKIPTTTDSKLIGSFLTSESPKIVFTTYQSIQKLEEAFIFSKFTFDLGIIDEAHNTTVNHLKSFSRILKDENGVVIRKRLFMTATPKLYKNEFYTSMNNSDLYGNIIYKLTTEDAINQKVLTDYKMIVMYISEKDVQKFALENKVIEYNSQNAPQKYLATKLFLEKAIEKYPIKKILSFHNSKERGRIFSQILNIPTLVPFNINSSFKIRNRLAIIEAFKKAPLSCICNPRIMMEGFDLPEIDTIIFSDLKGSLHDVIQAIGRSLRKYPNKKISHILFPIVVDNAGVVNKTEYHKIANIFSKMAESDGRMSKHFQLDRFGSQLIEVVKSESLDEALFNKLNKNLALRVWKKKKIDEYIDFNSFLEIIKRENIKTIPDYRRLRNNIDPKILLPRNPRLYYPEWPGWREVFGYQTESILSFDEFINFMQKIAKPAGINSSHKYYDWYLNKKDFGISFPKNIPRYPQSFYSEWNNWLEIFEKEKSTILNYETFKIKINEYSKNFGINSYSKYENWKLGKMFQDVPFPKHFPKFPTNHYKDWEGWATILGTTRKFCSYQEFKLRMQNICEVYDISSTFNYNNWCNKKADYGIEFPEDFPKSPWRYYKEWEGFSIIAGKNRPNYEIFKRLMNKYAQNFGIDNVTKYTKWAKGSCLYGVIFPKNFPKYPNEYYKEWESWPALFNKEVHFVHFNEFSHEKNKVTLWN